jgi:hypothetical protein
MARAWLLLLCLALLLWRPLDYLSELPQSLTTMGMRGLPGAIELFVHGIVAALAVAAAQALWSERPSGPSLAAVALIGSAAATVQTVYWTALPHQTVPGSERLISALAIGHAAIWLLYLGRSRRIREISGRSHERA